MKTILATTYALNPTKGSEDGMGWNYVSQIARHNKVIAVTRKNNREGIEKYMEENPLEYYENISFLYFDLPAYLRFWKKGSRGAMLYFYLWQMCMPIFIKMQSIEFDITHNLNFHNDWTPSFLWILGKPMIWGPVGHHPKIPRQFLLPVYGWKAYLKDRATWILKKMFWNIDPFVKLTKSKASFIWCMNSSVKNVLEIKKEKMWVIPSVASEDINYTPGAGKGFNVLSVGRFVPLKGFDVTIRSFAKFYDQLDDAGKKESRLTLVGKGPEKDRLVGICNELGISHAVTFIDWIERSKLDEIYRDASIFLFPSHEGAGMVVPEAMSYGLPVLCFDNVGPGEFVNEHSGVKTPYLAYNKSVEMFADCLKRLHSDRFWLYRLSVGARDRYVRVFEWNTRGELLKQIYQEIPDQQMECQLVPNMKFQHIA
ncbi:MAG: glycosyltransferase family 4 protein [Chitinophagales bacterium]|nr:glycosyltransferase family 4 protein [Chitinophagales bacterium]